MKRLVKVGAGLTALFAVQLSNPTTDTFAQKKSDEVAAIIEERLESEGLLESSEQKSAESKVVEEEVVEGEVVEEEVVEEESTNEVYEEEETPINSGEIVFVPEPMPGPIPVIPEEEEEIDLGIALPEEIGQGGNMWSNDTDEDTEVILPEHSGPNIDEGEIDLGVVLPEDEVEEEIKEENPYEVNTPPITDEEEGGFIVPPLDVDYIGEDDWQLGGEFPLIPENPKEEANIVSNWSMSGRVIGAYTDGKVEYELAFRHLPKIGVENVALEDAVFYLDLPEDAIFKSATFGGKYDAENHRVYWENPGGIPLSHANFNPFTPRRVNVQLFFEQPEGKREASAYATYVPKGGKELVTDTVTLEHGFKERTTVIPEGEYLEGSLAERPGVPTYYPILTGERFTYDIAYSMKSDKPYRNAELIVQLSDQLQFDKHVQLTGDFKTYYYDDKDHRFVFIFKPEIKEAQGVIKINNLYFPNLYTESGTEGMIHMELQYNGDEIVTVMPDILNAYADANWKVNTKVESDTDPVSGQKVTYVVEAKDKNPRKEGRLILKDVSVVHELAEEAIFKDAYTEVNGERIKGAYNKDTHTVTFKLDQLDKNQQLFYIDVEYKEASKEVKSKTTLTYQGLGEKVKTVDTITKHPVEAKESSVGKENVTPDEVTPEDTPSSEVEDDASFEEEPSEEPSTGGGGSSSGGATPEDTPSSEVEDDASFEEEPSEEPSTGGGGSSSGAATPEDTPSSEAEDDASSEEKPNKKPSTGGGGGSIGWIAPEDILDRDKEDEEDKEAEEVEKESSTQDETSEDLEIEDSEVLDKDESNKENVVTDAEKENEEDTTKEQEEETENILGNEQVIDDIEDTAKGKEVSNNYHHVAMNTTNTPSVGVGVNSAPAVTTPVSSAVQNQKMNQVVQKENQLPQTNEKVSMWAWLSGLLAMLAGLVVYFRPNKNRSDQK